MVGKGLVKGEGALIESSVHFLQLALALFDPNEDDIGSREHLDGAGDNFEGRELGGYGARPLDCGAGIGGELARRQNGDMRPRQTPRHQLSAEVIEELSQRIGNIKNQGEEVGSLSAVRTKAHVTTMVPVCRE